MNPDFNDKQLVQEIEQRPHLFAEFKSKREQQVLEDLARVNKRLMISEQIKTDFLSNIRNEIINPVTALLELSKSLTENADESTSRISGLIFSETHKLNFQMCNILASAELEAGEANISVSSVDLDSLIQDVVDGFETLFSKRELKTTISNEIPSGQSFNTDPEKLNVILKNLVSNAIQFSLKGGEIRIVCKVEDSQLHLSVRDFGIGISKEDQEEVFSRFTQLDRGTTKAHSGHGLGLSLIKALLEVLDGNMSIQSEPELGSTFTVHIPEANLDEDSLVYSAMGNEFLFGDEDSIF